MRLEEGLVSWFHQTCEVGERAESVIARCDKRGDGQAELFLAVIETLCQ